MGGRRLLVVEFVVLMLTACGLISSRSRVENITPQMIAAKDTGIVILTTGAPGICNEAAFFLQIRDKKTGEPVPRALLAVNSFAVKSEFDDHPGFINAVLLPPGRYFVTPISPNFRAKPVRMPTFDFEVQPARIVYVGELFLKTGCAFEGVFDIRDYFERDMDLVRKRNPALVETLPTKELLRPGEPMLFEPPERAY